ncbi:hypothetical protein PC116_g25751 [Phytophthora cactorum]|nr:hypothetical protein PC116_g25751 [Phytophthora cactorum]
MTSPFHKVVRKISHKLDEYEAAVVDRYTAVGENLTQTRVRVKRSLDSQEKKLSDKLEHCEAAIVSSYTTMEEHLTQTQERLKDKLNSQERKISEKAAHLLSKPGVPKMLRDKLSGECLAIEAEPLDSQGRVNSSKESFDPQEPGKDSFDDQSTVTSDLECSYTEFHTDDAVINKARIPREKVALQEFISRGAFGKVYKGTYNGQLVAVKTMSDVDSLNVFSIFLASFSDGHTS